MDGRCARGTSDEESEACSVVCRLAGRSIGYATGRGVGACVWRASLAARGRSVIRERSAGRRRARAFVRKEAKAEAGARGEEVIMLAFLCAIVTSAALRRVVTALASSVEQEGRARARLPRPTRPRGPTPRAATYAPPRRAAGARAVTSRVVNIARQRGGARDCDVRAHPSIVSKGSLN